MWHVPNAAGNESTLEGIEGNFALYKELGINSIVVEVTLRGFTFYKGSEYYEYSPEVAESYGEYDSYLDAFMALAEENEMEVHFWVSVYQYGDQSGIAGQEAVCIPNIPNGQPSTRRAKRPARLREMYGSIPPIWSFATTSWGTLTNF